jgi:tRNA threonylcarbamoyl adenosine modification protein YeaZ
MQLAIDTSTEIASIALSQNGEVIAELTWRCGQQHTVELLPNLIHLLQQARSSLNSIDGIVVAKGPGSFNGLRVGMSTVKGLAFSLGVPLVGISTLEVEASPYASTGLPICPTHNAGRGEIAAALYQLKDDGWCQLVEEHITTIEVLCSQINTETLFCGELSPVMETQLKSLLPGQVVIPEAVTRLRRAGYLAGLGWQRLERGDFDDPATLQPLYLRKPSITLPKPRR